MLVSWNCHGWLTNMEIEAPEQDGTDFARHCGLPQQCGWIIWTTVWSYEEILALA